MAIAKALKITNAFQDFPQMKISEMLRDGSAPFAGAPLFQTFPLCAYSLPNCCWNGSGSSNFAAGRQRASARAASRIFLGLFLAGSDLALLAELLLPSADSSTPRNSFFISGRHMCESLQGIYRLSVKIERCFSICQLIIGLSSAN